MKTLDRGTLRLLSADIQDALKGVASKYDVLFTMGSIRFSPERATFKLECNVDDGNGQVGEKQPHKDFRSYAKSYGMDPAWLDQTFSQYGKIYTIRGLLPRARKNNVLVERDGKEFVMSHRIVIDGMTGAPSRLPSSSSVNLTPNPTLSSRINSFLTACTEWHNQLYNQKTDFDYNQWSAGEKKFYEELDAIEKEASEGLSVGRVVQFQVADGYAVYIVTRISARDVEVAHVPLADAYQFSGAYKNSSGQLVIPRPVVEKQIQMADFWKKSFAKNA